MRKDNADLVIELVDKRIEELLESADSAVQSKYIKDFLNFTSKFYRYSAGNQLLIMAQCPDATYIAGYRTWINNHHRQVRKGEKGILIRCPILKKDGESEEQELIGYRAGRVFDIVQTDPIDEMVGHPIFDEKLPDGVNEVADTIIQYAESLGIKVLFCEMNGTLHGSQCRNTIELDTRICNKQESVLMVMAHEIAHWLLHFKDEEGKGLPRALSEVEAESVAYVVGTHFGINPKETGSDDYLAIWNYRTNDPEEEPSKTILTSLERIRSASARIIDGVLELIKREEVIEEKEAVLVG